MSQDELNRHLEDWVHWIFPQPWGNDNAGVDPDGNATMRRNSDSDVWFLSGTWGGAAARPIRVPHGTKLFIVIASSHAIPKELKNLPTSVPQPTNQDLIQHAKNVHGLWTNSSVTLDNNPLQIKTAETRVIKPFLADDGYYFTQIREKGTRKMATVAEVALLDSVGNAGERHALVLKAKSRAEPRLNEQAYDVDVAYSIDVT